MATLYLDRSDMELRRDHASLLLYVAGKLERRVPLRLLDAVVVHGNPLLHASALSAMADHSCYLVILPRRHQGSVMLSRGNGPNSQRRLLQYQCAQNPSWAARFAGLLLRAKLRAHARFLFQARKQRTDLGKPLSDAIAHLTATERHIRDDNPPSVSTLLGMEGAAASAYFTAYQTLFPPALAFSSRNRRPPLDPVNACLSLTYTLLHAEAVSAVLAAGLDPSIGFLHAPAHGRESFACDLVEPLRASADAWVWNLFRQRHLQAAHFRTSHGACLLGKAGRRSFYSLFEELRPAIRLRLRLGLRAINRKWNTLDQCDASHHILPTSQTDPLSFDEP